MDNSEKKEEQVDNQPTQTLRIPKETLLNNLIPVVLRQTDYTEEQAQNKLEEHNFDLKRYYMNGWV